MSRIITYRDESPGRNKTITVPPNRMYIPLYGILEYTADNTGGSRRVAIEGFSAAGNKVALIASVENQSASSLYFYSLQDTGRAPPVGSNRLPLSISANAILAPGSSYTIIDLNDRSVDDETVLSMTFVDMSMAESDLL